MRVVRQVAVVSVFALLTGCGATQSTFTSEPEPVIAAPAGAPTGGNGLLPPLPGASARPAPVATTPAPAASTPAAPAAPVTPPPAATAAAPVAAAAPARSGFTRPPPANGRGMPGQWTLQSSAGQTCALAFYGPAEATAGQAEANCGPTSAVTGLSGWSLDGGQLELSKGNDVIVVLSQTGPNQFQASAQVGGAPMTITVSR